MCVYIRPRITSPKKCEISIYITVPKDVSALAVIALRKAEKMLPILRMSENTVLPFTMTVYKKKYLNFIFKFLEIAYAFILKQ